jgi:ppGpp synthetase/RelA/SpoT-type nucleotidyltranferase
MRLTQMQDIAGCRVVVADLNAQDRVLRSLKEAFPNAKVIDRRKAPSHGYRAVHLVVIVDGKPIEIQLRTVLQHQWATTSEKLADTIDRAIKYGGGPGEAQAQLATLSEGLKKIEYGVAMNRVESKAFTDAFFELRRKVKGRVR